MKTPTLQQLLRTFVIGTLGILVAISLPPPSLATALIIIAAVILKPRIKFQLCGLTAILLPCLGSGVTLTLLALVTTLPARLFGFGGFFTALLGVWAVSDYAVHFPFLSIANSFQSHGFGATWKALYTSPPQPYSTLILFCTWFIGAELFTHFQFDPRGRDNFIRGLSVALFLSVLLTASALLLGFSLPHEVEWWLSQGRRTATFTDPNAFGICAFLGIVLILKTGKERLSGFAIFTAVGLIVCSLWSGSRSALIGIVAFCGLFLIYRLQAQYNFKKHPLASALWLVGFGILVGGSFAILSVLNVTSVQRLQLESFTTFFGSLKSRLIFWEVALKVIEAQPVIGVGLNRFADLFVAYSDYLGLRTGIWRDNPNSFYLWVVAELGIIGAFLFIFEASRLQLKEDWREIIWLPIFGTMLLFGPHLNFLEVNILFISLLSLSFTYRTAKGPVYLLGLVLFPFIGFAIGAKTLSEPTGLYSWEFDGHLFRWTDAAGRFDEFTTSNRATVVFEYSQPHHSVEDKVVFQCSSESPVELSLKPGVKTTVTINCPQAGLNTIFFRLNRSWIPAEEIKGSHDYRRLGMKLYLDPSDFVTHR